MIFGVATISEKILEFGLLVQIAKNYTFSALIWKRVNEIKFQELISIVHNI